MYLVTCVFGIPDAHQIPYAHADSSMTRSPTYVFQNDSDKPMGGLISDHWKGPDDDWPSGRDLAVCRRHGQANWGMSGVASGGGRQRTDAESLPCNPHGRTDVRMPLSLSLSGR